MDIFDFIPEKNQNWVVSDNVIYFRKHGLIPILKKIDGCYYISLDRRIMRKVLKLTNHLLKLEQSFFYCDRLTICEKHIHSEDIEQIVRNYIMCLEDEIFFKFVQNSEFDYINNLTQFLNLYDCHSTFKMIYESLKHPHFMKMWVDWYSRTSYYVVKNEEIRDFFMGLERQIKLNIFFS
jgi:hypothetical protein